MLIPWIEPGITAYKTIVITTSLYELLTTLRYLAFSASILKKSFCFKLMYDTKFEYFGLLIKIRISTINNLI